MFFVLTPLMPAPTAWFHRVEAFTALPEPVWIREKSDSSASFIARKLFIAPKSCCQRKFFAETSSLQGTCFCFSVINLDVAAVSFYFSPTKDGDWSSDSVMGCKCFRMEPFRMDGWEFRLKCSVIRLRRRIGHIMPSLA